MSSKIVSFIDGSSVVVFPEGLFRAAAHHVHGRLRGVLQLSASRHFHHWILPVIELWSHFHTQQSGTTRQVKGTLMTPCTHYKVGQETSRSGCC